MDSKRLQQEFESGRSQFERQTNHGSQVHLSPSKTNRTNFGSPQPNVYTGFNQQITRIQITSDWRDACINQEIEEVEKLEKFIQEEKARSHLVAQTLILKQQETEQRRLSVIELKKVKQQEMKQRNKEMAAKAGKKAVAMQEGSMADYEKKQELIDQKTKIKEAERIAKNKEKEEEFQRKLKEMAMKKEEFALEQTLKKEQKVKEVEIRDIKLKQMQEEKKSMQRQASQLKLEQTKIKLAESSVKRETALKSQRDTIEQKIQLQNIRAISQKQQKEYEIEQIKEAARQKQIQMDQILQQNKYEQELKKLKLKQQQEAMDEKIKQQQQEKKEIQQIRIEQEKEEQQRKKIIFKKINKEREELKKKLIEDKIEVKEASVKQIHIQKMEIIEQKKIIDHQKRVEKKTMLHEEKQRREKDKLIQLEKIEEEDFKYKIQQKEKQQVQLQVRLMREQLQMKKQKMINELRDLRKEYKLQEESKDLMGGYNTFANTRNFSDQQSNVTVGFGNTQKMPKAKAFGIPSVADSTHFNSKRGSRFKASNTQFKGPVEASVGQESQDNDFSHINKSGLDDYKQFDHQKIKDKNLRQSMNTRSLDNLENIKGMGGAQGGASLATIQGVIEENPFGKHKGGSKRVQNLSKIESRNTIQVRTGNAGLGTKIRENLESSSRLQNETYEKTTDVKQKFIYKQVFNTYLTPNSIGYLKYKGGINKASVANLFDSSADFIKPDTSPKKPRRHRSTLRQKKIIKRNGSRAPSKLMNDHLEAANYHSGMMDVQNQIGQRHQSISHLSPAPGHQNEKLEILVQGDQVAPQSTMPTSTKVLDLKKKSTNTSKVLSKQSTNQKSSKKMRVSPSQRSLNNSRELVERTYKSSKQQSPSMRSPRSSVNSGQLNKKDFLLLKDSNSKLVQNLAEGDISSIEGGVKSNQTK